MRLIDADALMEKYDKTTVWDSWVEINWAPTIDAVPVVRCKECRNRYTTHCLMYYECDKCGGQWDWTTDDDFCSYGVRKETEGEA